jgi:hypothetical protein
MSEKNLTNSEAFISQVINKDLVSVFFNLWSGTLGTAATTGLLYQPRVIVMVTVEKFLE